MMTKAKIELPPKLIPILAPPLGTFRYRALRGGRGGSKSYSCALMAAVWGYKEPLRILCVREFQSSIKYSFHAELKNAIESKPWLAAAYDVGVDYIKGSNGTVFIFKGIRNSPSSIKSLSHINLCIVEEAEDLGEEGWLALEPTIRAPKSEIIAIWNPKRENSPVDKRFVKNPPKNAAIVEISHHENPWFSDVLEAQRLRDRDIMSPATYNHVWNGAYLKNDEASVFHNKWSVEDFTPQKDWDGAYFGLDFGFSTDPTAAVKCWIHDENLYIEYDCSKVGLELDDTADFVKKHIPDIEKYVIRADCARPESISFLKRKGLPRIIGCTKGKGSVEDGIAFMKSHRKIIVHPRCTGTANEMALYSYKVDRLTGDIMPSIVDTYNHFIDGIRYALEPAMKRYNIDYSKLL